LEIHAGSVGGRHQTNAKVHGSSQLRTRAGPFLVEATWCVVDHPLRDAPASPDVINCLRYVLMSPPEEIEVHVMSQMSRTEREGALQLGEDLNIAPVISLPLSGTRPLQEVPDPR
jgi:hypothetical protein